MYKVRLFDPKEYRYFTIKYLYYTKKEIMKKVKIDYPNCELIHIDRIDRI